jgi:hypothetical protein
VITTNLISDPSVREGGADDEPKKFYGCRVMSIYVLTCRYSAAPEEMEELLDNETLSWKQNVLTCSEFVS